MKILPSVILATVLLVMANSSVDQIANVADKVIQKYKDDPFERMRMIYNVELRPFQWEWFFKMDTEPDVVAKSCKRTGKSVGVQIKNLDENVIYPDEEEMVFAPKKEQAQEVRRIQNDIIERSKVLQAYLKRDAQGKKIFGKSDYEFINNSRSSCFGVTSNFEGWNATKQHIDETDDIPAEYLNRILGRSIGANKNGLPSRHRFTGVILGKLNLYRIEKEWGYYILPPVNVYQGIEAGYLDRAAVMRDRQTMSDEEWLRTYCLIYVESRNFIYESRLLLSQQIGMKWNVNPIPPSPGLYRKKEGEVLAFGLDMGAQGAGEDASDYSLQVTSSIGPYRRWLYSKTWPGTTDPEVLINDVCNLWSFFQPNGGYADALQANLVAQINDRLYELGYTSYNWRILGANELEGWPKWAKRGLMAPVNNSGRMKHHMYNSLKNAIDNCMALAKNGTVNGNIFIFPQVDRKKAEHLEHHKELLILQRELANLQAERTNAGYYKISRITKKIEDPTLRFKGSRKLGDDRADALAMANHFLDFLQVKNRRVGVQVAYIPGV